jgi:hypothetical protein
MARRLLWSILRVFISVALLSVIVARADSALIRVARHVDPQLAAFGLAVGALTVVLGSIQWRTLLSEERINLTLPVVTGLYFLGLEIERDVEHDADQNGGNQRRGSPVVQPQTLPELQEPAPEAEGRSHRAD